MRYDTPVYFQRLICGDYDKKTGDYADNGVEEVKKYASVMDASAETMHLVYGAIRQGCLKIQLQNRYTDSFDRIRIGQKTYQVDSVRNLRTKQTFIVSEVQ